MGFQELVVILFIALLLVGAKRLPELAQSVGHSVHILRETLEQGPTGKPDAPDRFSSR